MNIILTGASRGLGFETARILAADGQNQVFAIARSPEGLNDLEKICRDQCAGMLYPFPFDLIGGDFTGSLIPEILSRMQSVDILINNAGALIHKPFEKLEETDFDHLFNVNVKSAFKLIRYLLPYFSCGAHIVNIGSMGGYQGSVKFPGLSVYSASKGALAILTECLAEEFKDRQIRVNCLALGSAATTMLEDAFPGYKAPLSANEMAQFIAHFAVNGHRWFNGKILPVAVTTP